MTNESKEQIKAEDIKTLDELRQMLLKSDQGLVAWAQKRIQDTQYTDAVRAELVLHRTDMVLFAFHKLLDLIENKEKPNA